MGCNVASIILTPCFWTKVYSGGAIFYWLHTHLYCVSLRLTTSCMHHSCVRTVSKEENVHLPQSKCLLTLLWTHGHTENSSLVHLKSKTWFVVVSWLNLDSSTGPAACINHPYSAVLLSLSASTILNCEGYFSWALAVKQDVYQLSLSNTHTHIPR